MKKTISQIIAIIFIVSIFAGSASAQCAMCRAAAGSSIQSGTSNVAKGLNKGILYLMTIPYIIGGVAGIVWYKNRKKISSYLKN